MSGENVLGATTGGLGAGAIAVLPNTGGNRSVLANLALLSLVVGLAILVSTAIRFVVKRHYSA
jgi:hypothetical protein